MSESHRPRKRFGQNFLHDPSILNRMVESIAPRPGDNIVEIGPGEGALTCPLLKQHGRLTAIELDRDLAPRLEEKCRELGQLRLYQADAMKFDFSQLVEPGKKIRIVGNLPYNISTPILFHLASYAQDIQDLHVLLQREVAHRINALPGNKDYGRLSVMMQYTFATELLFDVAPGAFRPPPKVQSTFLRLTPHPSPVVQLDDPGNLSRIVTAAFSQRRKTLKNCLKTLLDSSQIAHVGIDPARRPETLTLEEFSALANMLESSAESRAPDNRDQQ